MAGNIFLGATEIRIDETAGIALVPIERSGDLTGTVTVQYVATGDTAVAGADYTGGTLQTVTFQAGQTQKLISIPITNDTLVEGLENFTFTLVEVTNGTLQFPRTAQIVINDDEAPSTGGGGGDPAPSDLVLATETVFKAPVPIAFEWLPGQPNTMLVASKLGVVNLFVDGVKQAQPFLDISAIVNSKGDRGLLDIELHPDFPNQPYIYAYYTVDPPETISNPVDSNEGRDGQGNRYAHLVRYTADASQGYKKVVPGSGVILLGRAGDSLSDISGGGAINSTVDINQAPSGRNPDGSHRDDYIVVDSTSHAGGDIEFDAAGNLLLSIGDGTSFNFQDPRSARVQDIDSLSGKVVRINPLTGLGVAGNPFFDAADQDGNASKVFQLGLRNPFRMTVGEDGRIFVSEVGWSNYEEINAGGAGANYGWPYYEGGDGGVLLKTKGYKDTPEGIAFYAANPTITAAIRAFSHLESNPGYQMQAIIGGPIYSGSVYPTVLKGDYFFTDLASGEIFTLDVNDPTRAVNLLGEAAPDGIVAMEQGPDGYIYYAALFDGEIGRFKISANPNPYDLRFSTLANRSNSADLAGADVEDLIYVFLNGSAAGVTNVTFKLDGQQVRVEGAAPWDFKGGTAAAAFPWDTTVLAEGTHTISATVLLANGQTTTVTDSFTVDNIPDGPPAYDLRVSTTGNRANSIDLNGATVEDNIFVFLTGSTTNVTKVTFKLDGTQVSTELAAPWDLKGGSVALANPFTTNSLAEGPHQLSATVLFADGQTTTLTDTFSVDNIEPTPSFDLRFSTLASRANSLDLQGATLTDDVFVFLNGSPTGVSKVTFKLDGVLKTVEATAPYDFAGAVGATPKPFDVDPLALGSHTISATVLFTDNQTVTITDSFLIA